MIRDQFTPKPQLKLGKYLHYRGDPYEVLDLACNSETLEWFVVYKPLYDHEDKPDLWVRPYNIFVEEVEKEGVKVPRFKKVED
jgi:hypothetical protein